MPDIITDFHGTLYTDTTEGPLWNYVAKQAVKPSEALRHPARTLALARAKPVIEGLVKSYERGEIGYHEIYEAFNDLVLSRLPYQFVKAVIRRYAEMQSTMDKVDFRVVSPILAASGKKAIISTGSKDFICDVTAGFTVGNFPYLLANYLYGGDENRLRFDYGGITPSSITSANKPTKIRRLIVDDKFNHRMMVYLGDNADEEPAFEFVRDAGGKVVVPFLATDEFKQHAAQKYGAFVPETQEELQIFLDSVKG